MAADPMSVCPPAPGSLRGFSSAPSIASLASLTPAQKAAIGIVLELLVTQETKDDIKELFVSFDIDKSGEIEWADLVAAAAGDASEATARFRAKFQWLLSTFDSADVGADGDGKITAEEFFERFRLQAVSVLMGRCAEEINRSMVEKSAFVKQLMQASQSVAEGMIPENTPLLRFCEGNSLPLALAHAMIEVLPGLGLNVPADTDETMLSDADTITAYEKKVMEDLQRRGAGSMLRDYRNEHASARRASDGSTFTKKDVTKFLFAIEAYDPDL